MRLGAWLDAGMTTHEVIATCQQLESSQGAGKLTIDSVWLSEAYIGRDSITLAAAAAMATKSLLIATAVVNPFTRHPVLLAMTALTMNELSPERFILGVGAGESHWMQALGYDFRKPLTLMRDAGRQIRRVLQGEPVEGQGHRIQLIIRKVDPTVRLYLAAVGPRMCTLAGQEFEGCILPIATPDLVRAAVEEVRQGEVEAGRKRDMCETVATLLFASGDDVDALRDHLRRKLGLMLTGPGAIPLLERSGIDPEYATRFHESVRIAGLRSALGELPDELVNAFCVYGRLDRCLERLAAYQDAGLDVAALMCEPNQVQSLVELSRLLDLENRRT